MFVVYTFKNGTAWFYTGRAGDAYLSPDFSEAWKYSTLEGAQRKAHKLTLYGFTSFEAAEAEDMPALQYIERNEP